MSNASGFKISKKGVLIDYKGPGGDVVIPEGVTSIGNGAFSGCSSLTGVVIPDSVTSIGNSAFRDCSSLTGVVIPDSVTSIGNSAFRGCSSLTSVVIPEGVTSIGDDAFLYCNSLKSVVIPEGVTSIGDRAFRECRGLAEQDGFVIVRGVLYNYYGSQKDIIIPDSVTSIGDMAFKDCSSMTSAVIPNGVTSIGDNAFLDCSSMTSVVIPEGVNSIGNGAFWGCSSMTSVVIPEGVTSIGDSAFSGCSSLTSVVIPEGVTSIGDDAFLYCNSLKSVVIPEGVTCIGGSAFRDCSSLTGVVIPEGVTSIGDGAFSDCSSLTDVVIPEGVTSIGDRAFSGCSSLTSVVIPDSVTKIGSQPFRECKKLTSIRLPAHLEITKDSFGDRFPKGLAAQGGDLALQMKDGALKQYILQQEVWKTISAEKQFEIFMVKQGKSLTGAYLSCISNSAELGQRILERLAGKPSAKDCTAAANLMTMFAQKLDTALLRQLYEALKPLKVAARAVKSIEEDVVLMKKLGSAVQVDSNLSAAGRLVMEQLQHQEMSLKDLEAQLKKYYALTPADIPPVNDQKGEEVELMVLMWLLTAHEMLPARETLPDLVPHPDVKASYEKAGLCQEAEKVVAELDPNSFRDFLRQIAERNLGLSGNSKKMFLAYPICRYADEQLMEELTKKAPSWRSSVSGNDAPPLLTFRSANAYSNTRASMLFADKYHELDRYARIRNTDADTIRDRFLSDVGLDAQGGKSYDLGNQVVVARLQKDLSFLVELPSGKVAKSLPKKGADEKKYAAANADFSEMKKSTKKIVKNRSAALFEDFLSGSGRDAKAWRESYLNNPLLRSVACLLVWSQGKNTFIVTDVGPVTVDGAAYSVQDDSQIALAHPMEMEPDDVAAWQKYFTAHGLKQPFEQIWEPVVDGKLVKKDRYAGCMIPYYRFTGQTKRGIYVANWDFHNDIDITIDGCDTRIDRIDRRGHGIDVYDRFEIVEFSFKKYDRRINHLVAYFDRITVYDRVRQDDVTVELFLPRFTLAQISEFIKVAGESNAINVMALLLDYKNRTFATFDPMEEFSLDL